MENYKNIINMKKPTFSKIVHWILFLFKNFLENNSFFYTSIVKEWRNLKNRLFQKGSLCKIQFKAVFLLVILFGTVSAYSQIGKAFTPRLAGGNISVKGDVVLIGNSIINRAATLPVFNPAAGPQNNQLFTGTVTNLSTITSEANVPFDSRGTNDNNNNFFVEYSNVDPGTAADGIFSSSSADLKINQTCKKIKFAGLYWSAIYPTERSTSTGVKYNGSIRSEEYNKIKLKLPGATATYQDITADDIIFTSNIIPVAGKDNDATFFESPYVCFKDVTSLLAGLKDASGAYDANGKYTVANVRATRGKKNGGGAGGWTLVVIYETPTMPSKFISVFDGYASVNGTTTVNIPITGYKTLPSLKVNAKIGVAALEGDVGLTGDTFQFRNDVPATGTFTSLFDAVNDVNNFFNATISDNGAILTNRNPASLNSMGFDIDNVIVPNANNAVIPNSASAGTLKLTTNGDGYGAFLTTFAVEVIEPNVKLTKKVINAAGTDITNLQVNRGDVLRYVIGFENIGSDKAKDVYIEDYLPNIVFFNPPTSAPTFATLNDVLSLPTGVTVYSYDPAALDPHDNTIKRKIVFKIDNSLVDLSNDQERFITFRVTVPTECKDFSDACSNEVTNIAYSKYTGEQNTGSFGSGSQPPSVACALGDIATNFIGNIDGCLFDSKYTLCGNTVAISGRNGFQNYTWTGPNGFTATGQTINVSKVGDYIVKADPKAPCLKTLTQTVTVELYSNTDTDALLKYAANLTPNGPVSDRGEIVQCAIDGKKMPHIFLCGAGDHRDMTITNSAVKSVDWYQLTGAACIATAASNSGKCANEDLSCSWNLLQTSNSYSADTAGYFKAVVRYDNGCFNTLYFNVYKNDLNPTESHTNIICTKPGTMTVGGVPASGYEYSFNVTGYTGVKTYTSGANANVFSTTTPQNYTASIRQIGVTDGCVFTVSAQIDLVDFKIDPTVTQPTCTNVNGSIKVTATAGGTNYVYTLSKSGSPDQTVGPISATNNTFSNQSPGTYSVNVKTAEGCNVTANNIVINTLQPLTATVGLTKSVTCTDGEITIYPVGGTPFAGTPAYYLYSVNGAASVANPVIPITLPLATGGVYNIQVVDQNNCNANTSITITAKPQPVFTVKKTDIVCYGSNTGSITFDVTSNTGGYTLDYSIDNGTTYLPTSTFSNLAAGSYNTILRYTLGTAVCYSTVQGITIAQPSTALTASAGVSELAGCGDGVTVPKNNGKVRITNPQGGTAPYTYSFDNQTTWVSTNEAYKAPGTYTLYIKDSKGCIYAMPGITIDPEPVAPTINVASAVYNCDGTANSTVTVTNPNNTSFSYNYYLDGTLNPNTTDPKTFLNVPSGSHTISVEYKLQSVPTYSNLLNEDFGVGGNTTTPGIAAAYCFHDLSVTPSTCTDTRATLEDNQYEVTNAIIPNNGNWFPFRDHTSLGAVANGRFLAVNIGSAAGPNGVLYSKPIIDVIPNQPVKVDLYVANLLKSGVVAANPDFIIELVTSSGTVVASQATGVIPTSNTWILKSLTLDPGNNTNLTFKIRSGSILYSGNDAAIDDIQVYQLPKTCITKVDFPFVVPTGKGFTAQVTGFKNVSCAGAGDGEITITAQNFNTTNGFQYSIDNGVTWNTSLTSPVTKTGLSAATYNVQIRYDATSTGSCVKTISQPITSPTAVTVTANVTTLATCTNGAAITAAGSGGTPAYQYELRQSNGITVVTAFNTNPVFTNVPAGSYTVFVKDANSCVTAVSASVSVSSPVALSATIDSTSDFCYDTVNQASLKVNVSGGKSPFAYSLDGAASQTGNTFTNVGVGTHTIVVTDSNNCTATISNITIAAQLQLTANLTQDLTCLVNASMTTAVSGGYGAPYTYTVTRNGVALAAPTFPYTTSTAGNYVFTVTDSKSCPATSNTITVSAKTTPTLTTAKTDITCNNANNGTITVTASNGFTTVYTYAIKLSSASTYTTQATNQFTGLAAGTYNIKVIDSKGCESAVSNVSIVNPAVVTGTISTTDLQCSTTGTVPAVVTVAGAGGTAPYKYSFNGTSSFTTTNTYSTSAAGAVTAYIQDANGCQIGPLSITVAAIDQITDITITDSGYDCSTSPAGGHVNIAAVKGSVSAPIRYQIISGPAGYDTATNSDGEFKSLAPGSYIFQATDTKTNCFFTKSYTVNGAPDVVAGGSVVTSIKCFGGTGTIQFTVNGVKDRGYDYVIKNAANTTIQSANNVSETITTIAVATAQPVGVYTITVTDRKTKCTAVYSVTLSQPTAAVSISSAVPTKVNCNNDNSQITVTAAGGTPNYSYAAVISGASAPLAAAYGSSNIITVDTNSAANLVWDVYVKDVNGCISAKKTVTITQENVPTIVKPASQCYTGTPIAITITGTTVGTPSYSIDNVTYVSSPNFNLGVGSYTLYIKDGFGCTAQTAYTVAPQLTLSAVAAADVTCTPNTTINLTASGGTGAYAYQVSTNGGTTYSASANPYVTATAGNYIFKVTDAATPACSAVSTPVTVTTKATVLTLTTTKTDVKCKGDATGTINITPTSGKAPYTYSVTKGAAVVSTTASTTGLTAGTYNIVITDALGCTSASTPVTISEPAVALSATATAPATTTCSTSATVTVTGHDGTAPYTYSFKGGAFTATNTYIVNDNGTDQVIAYQVMDANGCTTVSQNITVKKLNPPTGITFSTPGTITCLSTTTSVTLTPVAGVSPFTYLITAGPGTSTSNATGASSGTFTGLASGNYTFEVTDANGCKASASLTIAPAAVIAVSGSKTDIKCFGVSDGTATFTITGASGVGNYTYTLSPASGSATKTGNTVSVTGLASGTYTLQVVDITTGCSSNVASVTINPATAITFTATGTKISCNNKISTISFPTLSGGTPGYTYAFVKAGNPAPAVGAYSASTTVDTALLTTSIDVYVKDSNGCTPAKQTITIGQENVPTIVKPASQCYTGTPIAITITGTTVGTPSYSIDNVTYVSSPNFNLGVGSYTLYIKDGFGCTAQTAYTVAPQLTLSAVAAADVTCTPNTTINLTASGGTGAYAYQVSTNGGTTYSASANPYVTATAGNYIFKVTDAATPACSAVSTPVTVTTKATVLTLTTTKTDVKCKGDATGTINITPTSGKAPYTYSVTKGAAVVSTTASTTGLTAGTYNIVITDALGCTSASTPVTISEPAVALSATATAPATTTCSTSATVTVTGHDGTAPYTYSFKGGAFTTTNTYVVNDNGTDQVIAYQVMDANGCTTVSQNITVYKLNPPTIGIITGTAITCNAGQSTSDVTIPTTNGLAPLSFVIVSGPTINTSGAASGIFTGLASGSYVFKVTDANGCSDSKSFTVNPVTPIDIKGQNTSNVLCNGGNTGIAKYTVTGFSASGNYVITVTTVPAALLYSQSVAGDVITLSNLAVGSYTVNVKDNTTGCSKSDVVTITQPASALAATYTTVNANCNVATSKVTVNVTAGTGTPGYTYSFSNSNVTAGTYAGTNIANLNPALTWYAWVKDANGCTVTLPLTLVKDAAPSVTATATGQCLGVGNFTITANGSGGIGALSYSINNGGSYQTGNTFVVSTVGSYSVRVKDANGCTSDSNVISVAPQLTLTAVLDKGITCNAVPSAEDAQITVTPNGGVGTFSYTSSPATGSFSGNVFSTSASGSYTFTVTDATTGCTAVTTKAISVLPKVYPDITGVNQTAIIKCHGDNTGAIKAVYNAALGLAPFQFSIDGVTFQNSDTFTALTAGTYTITIKDAKGCTDTQSITITDPPVLAYTYSKNEIICNGSGTTLGSIIATPTGGTAPYTYTITNNVGATVNAPTIAGGVYTFDIVNFGIYELSFVDANGCSVKKVITMASPPTDLSIDVSSVAASCTSATIEVTVNPVVVGGPYHFALFPIVSASTPPYDYFTNMGSYKPANDSNSANPGYLQATFAGLNPGVVYSFIVFDEATNCYYFKQAESPTLTTSTLTSTVTPNNVKCMGDGDGTVDLTFTNTYPVATDVTYQVFNSQTNLAVATIPVGTAPGLTGTVTTTVNGLGLLAPGTYYILFKENSAGANNGCTQASVTFTISESPVKLTPSASVIKNANCTDLGIIEAQGEGGTAPYTYQVVAAGAPVVAADWVGGIGANIFTRAGSLAGIDYDVHVKDAYGCDKFYTVKVVKDAEPTIIAPATMCYDGSEFEIKLGPVSSASIAPATYSVNGSSFKSSPDFAFNSAGTYNLVIKDGNGCTANVNYIVDPKLTLSADLTKKLDCTGSPDAVITLTATGGNDHPALPAPQVNNYNYEVSTDGGLTYNPIANPFITNVAGTYDFRVTDANALPLTVCQATTTMVLDPKPATVFTVDATNLSCFNSGDGTITVNVTSGEGPYKYSLDGGVTEQTSNVFTALPTGIAYVVTVRDARNCTFNSASFAITEPVLLTATASFPANTTCSVATVITVVGHDGTQTGSGTGYYYSFDNGVSYSTSNTYTVNDDGTVHNISYTVKDANGCTTAPQTITVNPLSKPTDLTFTATPVYCLPVASQTSTVNVTADKGVGAMSFKIIATNSGTAPALWGPVPTTDFTIAASFPGLLPGDYTFQVSDSNGCSYEELYTVKDVVPIAIVGELVNDISCNAANGTTNNGTAKYTVTGFSSTGNYNVTVTSVPAALPYTLTQVGDEITLSGLSAGSYNVAVDDVTTGCTQNASVAITNPAAIAFTVAATKVFCSKDVSEITVSAVSGGTGAYTYAVLKAGTPAASAVYSSSNILTVDTNLVDVSWDVYVKDANGCILMKNVGIINNAAPTIIVPDQQCFTGGSLSVDLNGIKLSTGQPITTVYGGVKSYTLNGSNLASSIATFTAPGTYVLGIKDDNGCEATVNYTIEKQLLATATLTKDLYCSGSVDATIDVVITDGVGPFSTQMYSGIAPTGTPVGLPLTGSTFTASVSLLAAGAGDYYFVTTDSNAAVCTVTSNKVTVTSPVPPVIVSTPITQPILCAGGSATMQVNIDGTIGLAPYTYSVTRTLPTALPTVSQVSNNVFTGLSAGTYDVVVTDGKGCISATTSTVIGEPVVLTATASFPANSTCSVATVITVVGHDGTPTGSGTGYYYSFDNGVTYSTSNTLTVNDNGTIQNIKYAVKDANGCATAPQTITVNPLSKPTDLTFTATPVYCVAPNLTSTVNVSADKGVGALKFEIIATNSGTAPALWGPVPTTDFTIAASFPGLLPGDYTFQVTDSNGCSYVELYTVKDVVPIAIVGELVNDISCNAANGTTNNGKAKYTVTGFSSTGNYNVAVTSVPAALPYALTQTGDVIELAGLSAGSYNVAVTDITTGCSQNATVVITNPAAIVFTAAATKVFCSKDVSEITVSAVSGGTGAYTYAVLKAGTPAASAVYSSSNILTVDTNLVDVSWDVYVKDANGCILMKNVGIINNAAPTIIVPDQQCFTGGSLSVDLNGIKLSTGQPITTVYGGVKSYTLNGSNLASSIATFTAPGTYVLGIKDDNGCEATVNYIINKQLLATATMTKDLFCTGSISATIKVDITDGVAPYTYQMYLGGVATGVSTAVAGSNFTVSVATAGSYYFVIKDSNSPSCSVQTNTVIVNTPTIPTGSAVPTNVTCSGGADGIIKVTPANGIAPYTYTLSGPVANTTGNTTGIYTGLPAGSYSIIVKDAKGCSSLAIPVSITQPAVVSATAAVTPFGCNAANAPQDAIVTITPGGGTPGYSYSFDGGVTFQSSPSFTVNSAKTINYVVHDANGCSTVGAHTATVLPYTPPKDMDLTASPIYCSTIPAVSTVTVNSVTGGFGSYKYEIISPATAVTAPSVSNSFPNLAPDTYVIKVTDANGCSTTKSIVVKEADKISVTAQLVNDVFCKGGATGAIKFTAANYITSGSYTPSLSPSAGTMTQSGDVFTYTNLPKGNYTFTIVDNVSGCSAPFNFTINEPSVALSSTSAATNINCNNDTAIVTITANGGTAPYKYAIARASDPVPGAASFVVGNKLVIDTNNGSDMNWIAYVKDANGCDTNNVQPILLDAKPIISSAVVTQCPSLTGTYSITVTASGFSSALQYSVDGVSFQTGNVITVNAPGAYNVTVKDANGCLSASTPVTILQPLVLTSKVVTSPSCANNDGVINVSTTGGSGNYVYNIDGGAFGAAAVFNSVVSGSHTMGVKDTSTFCEVYVPVKLTAATPVTGFILSTTPVSCKGGNDGTIIASMATPAAGVNDNPVYMYSLNGGTPQTSNLFTGLTAGNYTVSVISGRGCPASASIPVTEPGTITVPAPAVAQFGCTTGNTGNFATITVSGVRGGSGTYLIYEFIRGGVTVQRGSSNVFIETNVSGGSYVVNVYDNKGCQGSTLAPISIAPFTAIDKVKVVVNNAITCANLENITATAVDASGTAIAGIQYSLVDVSGALVFPSNPTGVFTGLAVGNYIITAANLTTGCSVQEVHYVFEPNTFELTIDNVVDVTCFSGTNGSAKVTLVDRDTNNGNQAGAFTYTLVDALGNSLPGGTAVSAGPINLSGLAAGTYTVTATLTNSPKCTVSKSFTITGPTAVLKISETHTAITCITGNNDGSISVTAVGGWPGGYEFQLETLAGTAIKTWSGSTQFTGLVAGNYIVKVRDTKTCVDQVQVNFVNPTPIAATIGVNKTTLSCFEDTDATITVNLPVTGGSGVYNYTLETTFADGRVTLNGPQSSNVFTNLGAASYKVIVSDTWTCSAVTNTVVINEPNIVTASLVGTSIQTCMSPATLTLSAVGGTGPYTYYADANFTNSLGSFTNSITFSVPFTTVPVDHFYYVKDSKGCVSYASNSSSVVPLEPLEFKFVDDAPYISCFGDNSGEITAVANGGAGNYIYTLLNSAGAAITPAPLQPTPGYFKGLVFGNYIVEVKSGDCTAIRKSITITQPASPLAYTPVVTDVTCNGNGDGKLVLTASGGTGIIKFALSPDLDKFVVDGTFLNLEIGHYKAIIQDIRGCKFDYEFDINEPQPIAGTVDPLSVKQELCSGEKTGEFIIGITGGVAPYSTTLDDPKGVYVQDQVKFTGLTGGNHTVYIKDANSCTYELPVALDPSVLLNPTAAVSNDCVDDKPANKVTVTIDPSNIPADVKYSLDSSGVEQGSNVFTNLTPGEHFIMVHHKNGCIDATDTFMIDKIDPLNMTLDLGGLNEIVATVTGGSGVYQFTVNGESIGSNNKYIYFRSGDYEVKVTDSNGCSFVVTKHFDFIDIIIPPIFTPNGDGDFDSWKPTNTENYPDIKFVVYDRYGRQVGTFGSGQSWDGKYNGTELPMGDYWYVLKLRHSKDDREFIGHFTLYR